VRGPGAVGVHGQEEDSRAAAGGPEVRPVHPRQRREGLPGPRPGCADDRHGSHPVYRTERWHGPSPRRDAEMSRPRWGCRRLGGPVTRRTWVLAGAAGLAAVAVAGGAMAMS